MCFIRAIEKVKQTALFFNSTIIECSISANYVDTVMPAVLNYQPTS